MSDLNQVILRGRLTRSAELKYLPNANRTAITEFSIANNKSRKNDDGTWSSDVSYFDCHIWGKYGEALQKNLTKGRAVCIIGRLKQDRWERDGQTYSKVSVDVSEVDFLPQTNTQSATKSTESTANIQQNSAYGDFPEEAPFDIPE